MPTKDTSLKVAEWDFTPPKDTESRRPYQRHSEEVRQGIARYIRENPTATSSLISQLFGVHPATVRKWFPNGIARRKEARGE